MREKRLKTPKMADATPRARRIKSARMLGYATTQECLHIDRLSSAPYRKAKYNAMGMAHEVVKRSDQVMMMPNLCSRML